MNYDLSIIKYIEEMKIKKYLVDEKTILRAIINKKLDDLPFEYGDLEFKIKYLSGPVTNLLQSEIVEKKAIISLFKSCIRNKIEQYLLKTYNRKISISKLVNENIIKMDPSNIEKIIANIKEKNDVNQGNMGMCLEFLIKDTIENGEDFYKFNIDEKFTKFAEANIRSVSFGMACFANKEKTFKDIITVITNEKLLKAIIKNVEIYRNILGKNVNLRNGPIETHENNLINLFEIDYISEYGYIVDFKCSSVKYYDSAWLYQLVLYYFILLKQGEKYKGIMCFNPILDIYWKIDIVQLLDVDDIMNFLINNRII